MERDTKQRVQWTRLLGLVLMAGAVALALDPDYPVAPGASHSSADSPCVLLDRAPRPIRPVGECWDTAPEFVWDRDGDPAADPAWRVVLLDADLDVLCRSAPVGARVLRATDPLTRFLRRGGRFHWLIESAGGEPCRSAPVPLVVRL